METLGLRKDGRRAHEFRKISLEVATITPGSKGSVGSATFEFGLTSVQAVVFGPQECTFGKEIRDNQAVMRVSTSIFKFSTFKRRRSFLALERDLSHILEASFETVVELEAFPGSEIFVEISVKQADGNVLAACANATTLALVDAGIPLKGLIVGTNASLSKDGQVLLDLNHDEERGPHPLLTLLLETNKWNVVALQSDKKMKPDEMVLIGSSITSNLKRIEEMIQEVCRNSLQSVNKSRF